MEHTSTQNNDVVHHFPFLFQVHKNGSIKRFYQSPFVPPSLDGVVKSKDVVVSQTPHYISARLFLPNNLTLTQKLPLLVYFHGGGFSIGSAFAKLSTDYLNSLVANSNVIAVSVEYRLAPEHPIPACYDDSWAVMQWLTAQESSDGPDPWLNDHADFGRVFLLGDSAGANIAHNIAARASLDEPGSRVRISGMVLVHPFFGNDEPDKLWSVICSEDGGVNDLRLNPGADLGLLSKLKCGKVLVCVAENDFIRERGWRYYGDLMKSEWGGEVEIVETKGEGHVFHLFNPSCEKAGELMKLVASFLNK